MNIYPSRLLLILFAALFVFSSGVSAQQMADPEFKAHVERPAYTKNYPRVLFDEAHNNFHTTTGRYKPFVDLIMSDGYHVVRNRETFTKKLLDGTKLLVIANALGEDEDDEDGAGESAFTTDEIQILHDWVKSGGALLLIADHAPFGGAAAALAKQFGIEMSKGYVFDHEHAVAAAPSILVYTRENKLLLDHPITRGREATEKVGRVVAFTGQALKTTDASAVFLKLGEGAIDRPRATADTSVAVGGQAQGLAMKVGKGRLVVLGEAAMLTAQISGIDKSPFGMNAADNDNRQLALNIMHWLSGALKP